MWWFILTFAVGLAVGKVRFLPAAFLRIARRMITPCLVVLVLLLGIDLGQQRDLMRQLPVIGWQSLTIALCIILASATIAWVSSTLLSHSTSKAKRTRKERGE